MWAVAATSVAMASPLAMAMTSMRAGLSSSTNLPLTTTDPAPMKTKSSVAINSAVTGRKAVDKLPRFT